MDRIQVIPCSIPPTWWTGYRYHPALFPHQGGQDTGTTLLYTSIRVDRIQVIPCSITPSGWTVYRYYPALYPHQGGQDTYRYNPALYHHQGGQDTVTTLLFTPIRVDRWSSRNKRLLVRFERLRFTSYNVQKTEHLTQMSRTHKPFLELHLTFNPFRTEKKILLEFYEI